ncbi:MAG: hypothetical protein AAF414_14965 [Pseudomonadota bacterium]
MAWATGSAQAQSFDPNTMEAADQSVIQQMLEGERSHISHTLPASQNVFTIVRTETQPRICRHFIVQEVGGAQSQGVGCRVGQGQWQLAATISQIAGAPAPAAPAAVAAVPSTPLTPTIRVIRPGQPDQGEPAETTDPSTDLANVPLPPRRPGLETATASVDLPEEEAVTPIARPLPASLASIPLPQQRPSPPAQLEPEQSRVIPASDPPDEGDADQSQAEPADTVIADGIGAEADRTAPLPIAQGDTDLTDPPDEPLEVSGPEQPEPADERPAAAVSPPLPAARP